MTILPIEMLQIELIENLCQVLRHSPLAWRHLEAWVKHTIVYTLWISCAYLHASLQ